MTVRAGRIAWVRELPDHWALFGPKVKWSVAVVTYEGLDGLTLRSDDPDILPPLPNETVQVIWWGRAGAEVWVSGRRFTLWRDPTVQYSPTFTEYSRVHVPADRR